jgi:phenylacetate-CoA ligase
VGLEGGQARVSILLVCFQQSTFTYASVSAFLNGAGFAKINLNPADWRDPADRARFIDDCQPEIFTGDPLSFAELARLPVRHRPRALISTAMQLLPGLRGDLEERFGCPVIDLYAMNEAGPIAASTPRGYALLQPRLFVEILDEAGRPCAAGARGEVTLTGGFNPFIPLLRYRTGDTASLSFDGSKPVLRELEGRQPVVFQGAAGQQINNIDVTGVLKPFALPRFQLHQAASGALTLKLPPNVGNREAMRAALLGLFGAGQTLKIVEVEPLASPNIKLIQYTREAA